MTFVEKQKLNVGWVWGLLAFTLLFTAITISINLFFGTGIGPAEWIGGLFGIFSLLAVLIVMATMNLTTQIDEYGIEASMGPFVNKKFFWREVESVSIDNHDNLQFGYKKNPFTKTHTLALNKGKVIDIRLRNGRTFRLGTQRAEEAERFLQDLFDTETEYDEPIEADLLEELSRLRETQYR